ncbi:5'-3' exoribonuclease [Anaeramoeba flamelloides]|uniref:5'-3' exoribonuclease n=1 Tax=Anaeramoeba flamelloides TaxID=1746091 RepID=A0AAV7Z7J7_9EUKA|nr:5'-3' exoribonuclease [Anaeramoeba flamelloides]
MGVPSFFAWLKRRYPLILSSCVNHRYYNPEGSNPNGTEFDNLYLDLNGMVHPAFHPDDKSETPTSVSQVFTRLFSMIDEVFNVIRPRKLLYIAIDGVAPMSKMNQQRSLRFRSARELNINEFVNKLIEKEKQNEEDKDKKKGKANKKVEKNKKKKSLMKEKQILKRP